MFWLASICTKQQYGTAGILFSAQQFVTILVIGGLVEACTSLLNEYRALDRLPTLFFNARILLWVASTIIGLLYAVVYWVVLPSLVPGTPLLLHVAVLLSGILLAYFNLSSNMRRLQEDHRSSIIWKSLPILLCYSFAIAGMAVSQPEEKIRGFFVGSLLGLVLAGFVALIAGRSKWTPVQGPHGEIGTLKDLNRSALPFLPVVLVTWLSGYGANFAIVSFFTKNEVAEFTMVLTLNSILLLSLNSLNQVWTPRFFQLALDKSKEDLADLNRMVNQAMMLLACFIAGLILLYFQEGVTLVGGNMTGYRAIHPYLLITFSSFVFLTGYFRSINYFFLWQHQLVYMRIFLFTTFLGLVVWGLAMWEFGTWGIYVGFWFSIVARGTITFLYARKKWAMRMNLVEISLGLFLILGGYLLATLLPGFTLRTLAFLFLVTFAAACFYLGNRETINKFETTQKLA